MALLDFLNIGMKVIDKIIPDPEQRAKAQLDLLRLQQEGAFKEIDTVVELSRQQTEINNTEAASEDLFKSGWRPAIGWIFAVACGWQFIIRQAVETIYILYTGHTLPVTLPGLDNNLWELGFGMLGLAGFRTFEKLKGK